MKPKFGFLKLDIYASQNSAYDREIFYKLNDEETIHPSFKPEWGWVVSDNVYYILDLRRKRPIIFMTNYHKNNWPGVQNNNFNHNVLPKGTQVSSKTLYYAIIDCWIACISSPSQENV